MTIPLRYGAVPLDLEELERRALDLRQRAERGPVVNQLPDGRSINGLPKTQQELLREETERQSRISNHKLHAKRLGGMIEEAIYQMRKQRDRLL